MPYNKFNAAKGCSRRLRHHAGRENDMTHLTITDLETALTHAATHPGWLCTDHNGRGYVRVETGRYKSYMDATVRAAERRGYEVNRLCSGVFAVYPKAVPAPTAAKSDAFDAVEFAKRSAAEAFDQRAVYTDPVGSYRDNVTDTMSEFKVSDADYSRALDAYETEVARLFAPAPL